MRINISDVSASSESIEKWCAVQDELDIKVNGENYKTSGKCEATEKPIRVYNAILSELNEVLDSRDWKHWKKGSNDDDNLLLELVDLMHFIPLGINLINLDTRRLFMHMEREEVSNVMHRYQKEIDLLPTLDRQLEWFTMNILTYIASANSTIDPQSYERKMVLYVSSIMMVVDMYGRVSGINDFDTIMQNMWKKYILKNALNVVRGNNGYKEGTYIKIWNGVEDNEVVLSTLLDNAYGCVEDAVVDVQALYNKESGIQDEDDA